MSHEYYRRGKNWFTAIGIMFCVMGGIVLIQQLLIWGIDFVIDFLVNGGITNEKVSVAMIAFGVFMVALGFRKHEQKR
ncbi:MAG: hypothetical protein LVO36_02200 [Nitrosopumilus sp. (ex Thoosa mismalolli)]|nr:hypothetical protein [Nitrosopumilus sp. (ex Thoosa mismalolli)]